MAKRFTFRLETVLTLRRRHEDEQRRVVAQRLNEWTRCQDEIEKLRSRVSDTIAQARSGRQSPRLDAAMALQEQRWRLRLHRHIAERRNKLREIERALHNDRRELARRSKDRKAIEKLKERRWQEHRAAQQRREQSETDEVAAQVYFRSRAADGVAAGLSV